MSSTGAPDPDRFEPILEVGRGAPPTTPPGADGPPQGAGAAEKNGLGLVSFVFSILGLLCLPVIGQLAGLICGLLALRREPRGFAIAGIAISAASGCLVVPLLIALLLPALGKARQSARTVMTAVTAQQILGEVQIAEADGRRVESEDDVKAVLSAPEFSLVDGWQTPFKIGVLEEDGERVILIWTAGPDTIWDTEDDAVAASLPEEAAGELGLPLLD